MTADNLEELSDDALAEKAGEIGLGGGMKRSKLIDVMRERRAVIDAVSREDLARILTSGGVEVQDFQSRAVLVREFYRLDFRTTDGLPPEDLRLVASLLGITHADDEDDAVIAERVEASAHRWTDVFKGAKRFFSRKSKDEEGAEDREPKKGVVSRMIHRKVSDTLRHTVDPYLSEKLDEIEVRIDRKLDDLDRKMDDWRTREVRHRLRIIKYTVIATVIVAVISLVYTLLIR